MQTSLTVCKVHTSTIITNYELDIIRINKGIFLEISLSSWLLASLHTRCSG